jgi:LytS/YehU family sensor histidine kinase
MVRAYLGLMAARMPRLQFSIDVPTDLLAAPCPPLMLISLAENAVRHGVEPKIGPAQVVVSAARTAAGDLHITVADDGAGFGSQHQRHRPGPGQHPQSVCSRCTPAVPP